MTFQDNSLKLFCLEVTGLLVSSSNEVLHRSEAIGRLAVQISEKHDWALMDKGQIREELLKKQAPSFAGKYGTVRVNRCLTVSFFCYVFCRGRFLAQRLENVSTLFWVPDCRETRSRFWVPSNLTPRSE